MREYELVVILNPGVADEEVDGAVERLIKRPIEDRGGELREVDLWGRRRLAYPIEKQSEGNYIVTQIRLDPEQTKELERRLHISEEIMRHLLVRLDEQG